MVREFGEYNKKLILQNGMEFCGYAFGAACESIAEIVFNTSMVGYQEIVTDPTYADKMVVMTYPLIGNYGITDEDNESKQPMMGGLIVREYNDAPSNFRYTKTLSEILEEDGIPGISGVDTRMLTRVIRDEGSQFALITDMDTDREQAVARLLAYRAPSDAVRRIGCKKRWYSRTPNPVANVVAVDLGIKLSIVRRLNERGINVTVVPSDTPATEILGLKPDGVFISNGPGNPEDVSHIASEIQAMRGHVPLFGIGLGHELIAMAYGAKIRKMKCGHHGNPPVRDTETGKIFMTSQGHSYVVDADSVAGTGLVVTHVNVLDGTIEGLRCAEDGVSTVQFHPESAPGPQDALGLFDTYEQMMTEWRNSHAKEN